MRLLLLIFILLASEVSAVVQIEHCPDSVDNVEECVDLSCVKALPSLPTMAGERVSGSDCSWLKPSPHAGYPTPILDPPIRVISI